MLHGIDVAPVEDDAVVKLLVAGLDDVVRVGEAERHEQEPRLVDVAVVLVHHRDRHLLVAVPAAEAVGDQGAARPRTQDHDSIGHDVPRPLPHRRYDGGCSLGDAETSVAPYDPHSNGILGPVRRGATSLRHAHETPPGRVRMAIECRPGKTTSREFTGMISGLLVDDERDPSDALLLEPSDTLVKRERVEGVVRHGTITARPRREPARIASYACGASSRENGWTRARILPASASAMTSISSGSDPQ